MFRTLKNLAAAVFCVAAIAGCNAANSIKDLADTITGTPGRETIDRSIVGVTNFFLEQDKFGTYDQQFNEISSTLGLHYVRILAAWTDGAQSGPNADIDFGYLDDIVSRIPAGVDVLIVLAHTPSWMTKPANWVNGDPRLTFIQKWVRLVVSHFAGHSGIVGYEVWNEPDLTTVASDSVLGLEQPANYYDLLSRAAPVIRSLDPTRLVVLAATSSIQQGYPAALTYNQELQTLGAEKYIDIWNIHVYGRQFEKFGPIITFLNSLSEPIWVTESGAQGPEEQLAYVEQMWPYLTKNVSAIQRIYYYEFASSAALDENFGLRTNDSAHPVSDLYVWLRDNK